MFVYVKIHRIFVMNLKTSIMQNVLEQIAINQVGFEYFKQCIEKGATPEQAKAEILTPEASKVIAARVKEILK